MSSITLACRGCIWYRVKVRFITNPLQCSILFNSSCTFHSSPLLVSEEGGRDGGEEQGSTETGIVNVMAQWQLTFKRFSLVNVLLGKINVILRGFSLHGGGGGGDHTLSFIVVSGPLFEERVEEEDGLGLSSPKIAFGKNQCYRCVRGGESHMDDYRSGWSLGCVKGVGVRRCWLQPYGRFCSFNVDRGEGGVVGYSHM